VDSEYLGNFLHGFFENYASNENLDPDHWFWDHKKSGGIFIEHGVHFFDLFSGWLGKGEVIHATTMKSSNVKEKFLDRAQAVVRYKNGLVNHFHGFNQPDILDRQEMRLQFERGDMTLYGWIPTKIKVTGFISEEGENDLADAMSNYHLESGTKGKQTIKNGWHKLAGLGGYNIELVYKDKLDKQQRYRQMLIDMMEDQLGWIMDKTHVRTIDHENAVQSLVTAEEATRIAVRLNHVE
jgi:predicted dehydrogenase